MEPKVYNTQENVWQKPIIAQESDINSEKLDDMHSKTERTNVYSEEITKSCISEQEVELEGLKPKAETLLPQPVPGSIHQETSGERNSDEYM